MKCIRLFVFLFFSFFRLTAQTDTSFWFVAPDISAGLGQSPIVLFITSYTTSANVVVSQPANATFTPITIPIPASSTASVDLTTFIASIENSTANAVLNRGLYIKSGSEISVNYCIGAGSNKEMISLKGRKGLGTDFYTPFQNQWQSSGSTAPKSYSAIDIVASKNNTKVAITPRANIIGHLKDVTFTVTLQAGETFSCRDSSTTSPTKLAGSIISSDSLISVTVSSHGLNNGGGCMSTIAEQLTTSQYAGTEFAVIKGTGGTDQVFILATLNSTSVTVNDGFSTSGTLINTGETYSLNVTQPLVHIKTTQPVYALHVSSFGCKLSGAQLANIYCQGSYTTAFTRTTKDSFAVNLYTRNGYQSFFQLNGSSSLFPASSFSAVPGTSGNIVAARFYFDTTQVTVGSYNTITNSRDIFGAGLHYGSVSAGAGYSYISEFGTTPFTIAGPTGTICSNTTYSLNGLVGGGNLNGTWSTTGYGTFLSGVTSLTNTYKPNNSDIINSPVKIVLSSSGPCPSLTDTLKLTVNQSPVVNASSDQVICGNNATVTLNGLVSGPTTTGIWSGTGSGTFVPSTTSLTPKYIASSSDTLAGFVKLVLTSTSNGICNAETDTMQITFTDPPNVNAGPATLLKCINNASVVLTGTVSGASITGKWTTSGSGLFSPNNVQLNSTYIPSAGDLASSLITLYLSSTNNGNCLPVVDSIKVNFTPAPNVNAGPDLNICKNNFAAAMNGTISGGATKGQWSGGGGSFSPSDSLLSASYIPVASELSAGFVVLTLTSTDNGNCNAVSDQVRIDYRDEPIANFSSNTVCQNQATLFTDFSIPSLPAGLATWNWDFGDGNTSIITNPVHTYSTAGTYTAQLIVKNTFNCYDTLRKSITVYNLPNADFSFLRSCSGAALKMNFTDSSSIASPDTIATYFWDYGGLGTSTVKDPIQVYPYPGVFNITHIVTSTKGCKDTIVKTMTVTPQPVAKFEFQNNSGFNIGTNVAFVDSSKNAVNWYWDFNDGNTSTVQSPNHIYYTNGTFTVMQVVSDQFGCKDTARLALKILTVINDITELIPNVISPNGDGLNDIWRLDFIDIYYPRAEIEIYNRWGQKLFQSVGYPNAWDGTYKGDALPVGTYFYIIDLKDPSKPDLYKGTILLMK